MFIFIVPRLFIVFHHRNKDTNRDEFIFYSKRLIRLVIEYSLSLLPYESVSVATPQGLQYEGRRCSVKRICGVSILRYCVHTQVLTWGSPYSGTYSGGLQTFGYRLSVAP